MFLKYIIHKIFMLFYIININFASLESNSLENNSQQTSSINETDHFKDFVENVLPNITYNKTIFEITPQIIGGEISPRYYPYQVSIQIPTLNRLNWQHNCGGAIISRRHVLTAAHCLNKYTAAGLSVLAGVKNLNERGSRHSVKFIKYHERYDGNINDIGIVKITNQFVYSTRIRSIQFNNKMVAAGTKCILTGWGQTYNKPPAQLPPKNLKRIQINTITNSKCKQSFPAIKNTNVCTLKGRNQSACFGDSGGPLALLNKNIIVGVVSYGTNPCGQGKPDIFTRVSTYTQWIKNNMK